MSKKVLAYIIALLVVIFIGGTTFLLVRYLPEKQELREKAATPEGVTTVALQPTSGTMAVGDTLVVDMVADITGYTISGITVFLDLTYNGATPPITVIDQDPAVDGIQIEGMIADLDYGLPNSNIVTVDETLKRIRIQLNGYKMYPGYTASQPVVFGRITLQGVADGSVFASFDANLSKITDTDEGEDILLIPDSTGNYTVGGGSTDPVNTPTPTPTTAAADNPTSTSTPTPTPTTTAGNPTSTPTSTPTGTLAPTSTPTSTPTPTTSAVGGGSDPTSTPIPTSSAEDLPVTGIGLPTMGILGIGLIFFLSALLLF